ncbi:SCO6745 family protein [Nocardioides sp. WG-D5]
MEPNARRLWKLLEPIHAVGYFSPEPIALLKEAGYRGYWMGYFAARSAPLGPVPAEVVHAVFYNFAFSHVSRALPDAWGFAPPEAAHEARRAGAVTALRRQLGPLADSDEVARAASLASRAALSAPLEGRPLYAALRSLPVAEDPLTLLWDAATLLREHRGDGHVATLLTAGIGGRESHVFHALATGLSPSVYATSRNIHETEWASLVSGLRSRGLVTDDGRSLTDAGRETKARIESTTDELAAAAYASLEGAEVEELIGLLRPLTKAVVASGEIPGQSPMGLNLDDIDR